MPSINKGIVENACLQNMVKNEKVMKFNKWTKSIIKQ